MGMRAYKLADNYTMTELLALQAKTEADPVNKNTGGGIYLYSPSARRLLNDIAQAITWKMAEKRISEGMPPIVAGYSGRNCN